jgi:hypothetical protein
VVREASSQPMLMLIMDVTFTPKDLPHACTSNYEMHPEIGAVKLQDIMATPITEVEYQVLSERATSSVWF